MDNVSTSQRAPFSPVKPTQPAGDQPVSDQPEERKGSLSPGEQKEAGGSLFKEAEPRRLEKKEFEVVPEVKEWIEERETAEEVTLPQPIKDQYGQVLLKAARPTKPKIVLPLDDQQMKKALKKKVTDSVRWLVAWCLRIIKMFPQRTIYGSSQ